MMTPQIMIRTAQVMLKALEYHQVEQQPVVQGRLSQNIIVNI